MKYLFIVLLVLMSSGCATLDGWRTAVALKQGYVQKSKLDTELTNLRVQMNKKMDEKVDEISRTKDSIIFDKDIQIRGAADGLYGADSTYRTILKPNRTDLITNNFVTEAWSALDNLMPSYQKMLQINQRLKKELDETQTSMEDLKKDHDRVLTENKVLVDNTKALQDKLTQLQTDIQNIKTEYGTRVDAKQIEIQTKTNDLLRREAARADDAKAIQAMKEKVTMILGSFALAALAGAIWSPVFKSQFGIFAAILGFAAIGVWYITGLMVWVVFGVAILALIGWVVYKHNIEKKAATATYTGLEDIKTKNPELWEKEISPVLVAWQSKYVVKDGIVTTVPDTSISKHINATLMATNQK